MTYSKSLVKQIYTKLSNEKILMTAEQLAKSLAISKNSVTPILYGEKHLFIRRKGKKGPIWGIIDMINIDLLDSHRHRKTYYPISKVVGINKEIIAPIKSNIKLQLLLMIIFLVNISFMIYYIS